ncbi:hypothetical protein [Salipiger aestuarii]|uniref:hypothetical protein n=1 Tax=Salipiger aestuarii TaxID=568098 RepID=UPI001CC31A1A|nr:hypothetical protein [Salipiger aestuarii]KAA8607186.1 hypothetical protein AL037_19230 [Salipiger aestuarii]
MTDTLNRDAWSRLGPLTLRKGETAQAQIYACLRAALTGGYFRPGEEISPRRAATEGTAGLQLALSQADLQRRQPPRPDGRDRRHVAARRPAEPPCGDRAVHFDRAMESHDAAEQALCDLTALSRFPNTLQTKD